MSAVIRVLLALVLGGAVAPTLAAAQCREPSVLSSATARMAMPAPPLFAIYGRHGAGFIDRQGKVVVPALASADGIFADGSARAETVDGDAVWVDAAGRLLPRGARVTGRLSEGLAPFTDTTRVPARSGYVDGSGKIVIAAAFGFAGEFHEGLAPVEIDGRYGYIDKSGRVVIRPEYRDAGIFADGRAAVDRCNSCGYIGRDGTKAFDGEFALCFVFGDQVVQVKTLDGKAALIDGLGRQIATGDDPGEFRGEQLSEGLFPVLKRGEGYGFVDSKGAVVIAHRLAAVDPFSGGRALATEDGKLFGYIDHQGNWAIAPKFCDPETNGAGAFSEGFAFACDPKTHKFGFIDASGRWAVAPQFEHCQESFGYHCSFRGGLAFVETKTHYQYINNRGRTIWKSPVGEGR
jgi:WG containing repeat